MMALALWKWVVAVFFGSIILFILFDWLRTWFYIYRKNFPKHPEPFGTKTDVTEVKGTRWDYEPKKKPEKE